MSMSKKTVKAWGILIDGEQIAYDGNGRSLALAVYATGENLDGRHWPLTETDLVVPIEIRYTLPNAVKKITKPQKRPITKR